MSFLSNYIQTIKFEETKQSVQEVTDKIFSKYLADFDYRSNVNGLLLGEVQSGKTGQMFGVIAAGADRDFKIFLVLTTDNKRLQEQTFKRALDSFPDFCVCSENDAIRFKMNKMRKPVVVVLKKNSSILKKWRNELVNSGLLDGNPLFVIDDEADAASLNTKVNQEKTSTINNHIADIRKSANSCVYLQVTATPQAVLLQTEVSEFKPQFVVYFKPGISYLGGNFFFSRPDSYCIRYVDEEEIKDIKNPNTEISAGLATAILNYLIVCADKKLTKARDVSNYLIHPSVRIIEHEIIANKIGEFLNDVLQNFDDDLELKANLEKEWNKLHSTKPEIKKFSEIFDCIRDLLFNTEFHISTLNSNSEVEQDFESGFNIVVGGNTLGRGVTFPYLQTVYYSRFAKVPQADTFWQHCRMFGYDRDRASIRLFMPPFIHKLFQELNNSQTALVKQIVEHGIDDTHLLYIDGVKPTRKNVVKTSSLSLISGGVNYFAAYPVNKSVEALDKLLLKYAEGDFADVTIEVIQSVLANISSESIDDWDSKKFRNVVEMIADSQNKKTAKLLVRTNRNIGKDTGTMLSPDDRSKTDKYNSDIVLVMYRVNGEKEKGWNGEPFWMPNIKLPEGFTFYKME
ncbi:MAG: Z1 domain-containing protein [Treponemataceae bacterium]|nr:Z1 domain-containing protein [Treponemataceae bacterium]